MIQRFGLVTLMVELGVFESRAGTVAKNVVFLKNVLSSRLDSAI